MMFKVIMADPPWKYGSPRALVGNAGRGSNGGQAARMKQVDVNSHYRTMTVEEICALNVASLADPSGCITNPFLVDGSGSRVLVAWGFKPVTVLTWGKTRAGEDAPSMKTGHWFRSASEHCLVGIRGKLRRPANYPPLPTWKPHPRIGQHSAKPTIFHEYAEQAVPEGPWLELFARSRRTGWVSVGDVLGDTVESFIETTNAH